MKRWLLGLALAMCCSTAMVQFKPGMAIMVEKLSPETGDCGVGQTPMHSIATLTLENSGIRVLPEAAAFLYIHPMVLQQDSTCFVHLDVSVRTRRQMASMEGFKLKEGWVGVLLCSATVSGIVPQDELGQAFMNQLVQQIKLCLENLEI